MENKILQIIDKLDIGGAEKMAVLCANIFAQKGLIVGLVSLVDEGVLNSELNVKVKYYNLHRKSKWNICSAIKFHQLVKKYDILHVHMHHNLYWILFWGIIFRKKYNIIFHNHNNKKFKWNILLKLSKSKISQLFVDKKYYNQLVNNIFFKSYFLENVVLENKSKKFYINDTNNLKIVLISNIRQLKNIEFALQIVNYLSKNNKVIFDIYYSNYDPNYFDIIKQSLIFKGVNLNVNFIRGDRNPRFKLYKYDLALHTSIKESGPLTLLEYMSEGLPFLSFNTGQSVELVKDIFPEFIISKFILEEWVININKILSNGRNYYSKDLKALYNKSCSNENYYKKCKKIYQENLA